MGWSETLLTYITDRQRKLSTKTYVTIICLALVIFFDNIIGISYHYSIDKKLTEIALVGQILKDTTLEKNTRKELITLRQELVLKKHYYDFVADKIESLFKGDGSIKQVGVKNGSVQEPRNNLLFLISSAGFFIIFYSGLLIIYPFLEKESSIWQKLAAEIMLFFGGTLYIALFYWLLGFVPKISDTTWAWNYTINVLVQMIFILLGFFYTVGRYTKTTRPVGFVFLRHKAKRQPRHRS